MDRVLAPVGTERTFPSDEIIVSKTDLKGRITYANPLFLSIADFTEKEILGKPHSVIRHPDMPRCIFHLLWQTISSGEEIFAYVLNKTKHNDYYWVLAHVTPTYGKDGSIIGYHSSRRAPTRKALEVIRPLYGQLLAEERRHSNDKDGMKAGVALLQKVLADQGMPYDRFVFDVIQRTSQA